MNPENNTQPQSTSFFGHIGNVFKTIGKLWIVATAVIGSLLVFALIGIAVALSSGETSFEGAAPLSQKVIKNGGEDKVALLRLEGPISESESSGGLTGASGSVSSTRVNKILDGLMEDDSVKAVVLRINSPGGTVVASDDIYRKVTALQKKKPVIASLGDTTASGGYYIAVASNKIVANPATITGSIGVIAQFPKLSGLYEKIGLEMRTIKSGEFKDIGSESRDLTDAEKAILNSIIKDSYDQFVAAVSQGRKMDEAKVRQLADGRIYSGKQAKENGLVDELGGLEDAIDLAADTANIEDPTIVEFSDKSFFESLLSSQAEKLSISSAVGADLSRIFPQEFGVYYLWRP